MYYEVADSYEEIIYTVETKAHRTVYKKELPTYEQETGFNNA